MSNRVFPSLPGLKWDVLKIPGWSTRVQRSVGGKEQRASYWSTPLYTWILSYELLRGNALLELQTLLGFFNACQGKFDSFLFSDPTDNNVTAMGFGVGDGAKTAFQLQRTNAGPRVVNGWDPTIYPVYTTPRKSDLLWQADFTNAAWSKGASTAATGGAADPAGGTTAATLTTSAVTQYTTQLLSASSSIVRTNSGWVRRRTGTGLVRLLAPDSNELTIQLTPLWQRFSFSGVATTARQNGIRIDTPGDQIDVWGFQQDDGTVATPNIFATSVPVTVLPAYWPTAGDGFEPVFDLDYSPAPPQIFVGGVLKALGTDYTISASGVVTFTTAPAAGAALSWTGSYFWRVRFDLDQVEFNNFLTQLWEAKKVTLVSVK